MELRANALVLAGGAAGTAARWAAASHLAPGPGGWPVATTAVNLLGALALGALLAAVPAAGAGARWRLLLGTGFLGAFTTWSALAVEVVLLQRGGSPALAVLYPVVSVVAGVACAAAGAVLGRRAARGARA